jgi:hypothetical protein
MRQALLGSALVALLGAAALAGTQDEIVLTLTCKPPPPRARMPKLKLDGQVPLPEDVILKLNVLKQFEVWAGGRIETTTMTTGGGFAEVKGKKFSFEPGIDGPALYQVVVVYADGNQIPKVAQSLKGKITHKIWEFKFPGWGDELAKELMPKLLELESLRTDSLDLVRRYEKACVSQQAWNAEAKQITKENATLQAKLERSEARNLYPAAYSQVFFTIRSLQGTSPYFHWEGGKFAGGKSYHADNQEIKTHRDEKYDYTNLKRYVEESDVVAGREFCLWVVKDLRRAAGKLSSDLAEALKTNALKPGIAPWAERLQKAVVEDLDPLEKEIRTAIFEKPADPVKEGEKPKPKSGS